MNFESNRRVSARRANEDFLRRMLGAESADGSRAVINPAPSPTPSLPEVRPNRPSCDGSYPDRGESGSTCQQTPGMPSLAMVYAPVQCWQNLLDPVTGLSRGSIFADLLLPFEGKSGCGGDCRSYGKGGCGV